MKAASAMASPLPSFCSLGKITHPRKKAFSILRAKSCSSPGEDDSCETRRMVDANMGLLKERMEVVRMRERLQRWDTNRSGWDYVMQYDENPRRKRGRTEFLETAEVVAGAFCLTVLGCALGLCLSIVAAHMT